MRKQLRFCRAVAVSLACLAWLLPVREVAAVQPVAGLTSSVRIIDVRLDPGAAMRGHLVDVAGQPLADRPVVLHQADGTIRTAQTDAAGNFVLQPVSAGVHRVTADTGTVTCRVWTHAAAPPSANEQLTLVDGPVVVRGQQPFSAIFTNPLFIGLVIAAAIAIPIAMHRDRPPSS